MKYAINVISQYKRLRVDFKIKNETLVVKNYSFVINLVK